MAQKDISLVRYFEDQERYADLINGFVFDGDQVVSEQDIHEMDTRVTGVFGRLKKRFMIQKYRDSVRKVVMGTGFMILGLENQNLVHYGMPVRIMLEDAASYDRQLLQFKRYHHKKRDLRGAEFLSGFSRMDRISPVITICIYYGAEPYDGARELYEMMEYEHLPEKLRLMLNNYKIHILEVRNFKDINRFRTDLKEVFGFIQRSGNPEEERHFTLEHKDTFQEIDEDAYDVITAMTGSDELEHLKEAYRIERRKINMCEAIRGMIKQGVEDGENRFAFLTEKLLNDLRTDDLRKAANDKQYRHELYQEYGIQEVSEL